MKRTFCVILSAILFGCCAGCTKKQKEFDANDYVYTRESEENMLRFSSSDKGLDAFLNDYLHRHLRYDENRIDYRDLGSAVTFGKEWEAYSLMFFDSTASVLNSDRQNMLKNFIDNVPVDRFGYVWNTVSAVQDDDTTGDKYFHQGWPFPSYNTVGNSRARGWEFANGVTTGWSVTLNGKNKTVETEVNPQGDGKIVVSSAADSLNEIEFVSPYMRAGTGIDCSWAPFLEFDIRITDTVSKPNTSFVDDMFVYFRHDGEEWDDSRMVSYSEFATTGDMTVTANFNRHIYFPMYLHPEWGTSAEAQDEIAQFKLVIRSKDDGATHRGTVKLNFARAQFDTRQTNNIGIFLQTAQKYLEFSGDIATLERNLPRFRKAAQFLIGYCNGANGLIDKSGFVGAEGSKGEFGTSIGNGYWDMLSTPTVSLYANLFFYRAIEAMLKIEKTAAENGIEQPMPKVWNKTATAEVSFDSDMTVNALETLLGKIRAQIQKPISATEKTGFWDETKGRFIEGFDSDGDAVDYGYVMYNLEAIATGVATDAQAKSILDWVNGDRIVEADKNEYDAQSYAAGKKGSAINADGSVSSEGTLGIYDFEFAPRVSTVKNTNHYYWAWNGNVPYAEQLQDGGATMYVSYYDILSRISTRGATDAFNRLKEIQVWYEKVKEAADKAHAESPESGYNGKNFYLAYYDQVGITLQGADENGVGGAGTLGLAYEFLESSMLYSAVPYGFFGISAEENGTLCVSPEMPASLDWWKMENLLYRGVRYDITIAKNMVSVDYVRGNTAGLKIKVSFDGNEKSKIYADGVALDTTYDGETKKVSAVIPLRGSRITVK